VVAAPVAVRLVAVVVELLHHVGVPTVAHVLLRASTLGVDHLPVDILVVPVLEKIHHHQIAVGKWSLHLLATSNHLYRETDGTEEVARTRSLASTLNHPGAMKETADVNHLTGKEKVATRTAVIVHQDVAMIGTDPDRIRRIPTTEKGMIRKV
jgi:hypothetical protein